MNKPNAWTPRYHFYSTEQRLIPFDPNGAVFWKGRYHIFYLCNDPVLTRECSWGHISSADLVHWKFHKLALTCDRPNEIAMFSGCAVKTLEGSPVLVYFSVEEGVCVARPKDEDLEEWEKIPENPVIPYIKETDPEFSVSHTFDPHVWVEDGHYLACLGSRTKPYSEYDCAYLYRSDDLIHWEYLRPLYQATDHASIRQDDCACPDFFDFGKQKMLLHISHARGARVYLGDWIMGTFVPRYSQFLNFPGGNLFAPESLLDHKGRRIAWFWAFSRFYPKENDPHMLEIWALPRQFTPVPEGNALLQSVPEEVRNLSSAAKVEWSGIPEPLIAAEMPYRSRSCRIHVCLNLAKGRAVIDLLSSIDRKEACRLIVDRDSGKLILDHSSAKYPLDSNIFFLASIKNEAPLRQEIPWLPDNKDDYRFDVYLDNGVVEVFDDDGRYAATQIVFNSEDSDHLFFTREPDSKMSKASFTFHEMAPLQFEGMPHE